MTLRLTVLAAALVLAGCGGGASSTPSAPSAPVAPSAPIVRTAPLEFGYFGLADIAATASSTTFTFAIDWGDWTKDKEAIKARIIAQLQSAKAAGLKAIVSTGFLTFDAGYRYLGTAELATFKKQLDALDLSPIVIALYPVDEPDIHAQLTDAIMVQCCTETRAAWPGVKLAVIYGPNGQTPGISAYDWIGRDDYSAGSGELSRLPAIRPDQQWIVVPGGADPWRQDVAPFAAFAKSQPTVAVLMPFLYSDYAGGKGIGTNGTFPAYAAAGTAIKTNT